jgi:hypothetical protein
MNKHTNGQKTFSYCTVVKYDIQHHSQKALKITDKVPVFGNFENIFKQSATHIRNAIRDAESESGQDQ